LKKIIQLFCFFVSLQVLTACGGGSSAKKTTNSSPSIAVQRGALISATLISTKQSFLLPYEVDAYKVIYKTLSIENKIINASGLLAIPQKSNGEKSPFLSYQHGTIFLNSQAPSIHSSSIDGIMVLAGTGYIVSAPDYLGYGESSKVMHPYIHAESLASASVDMLRASKVFLAQEKILHNSQLFLAGYSEGGYATLALQKTLLEAHSSEFVVTASAAGAGPFDLAETSKIMAEKTINQKPAYLSFLLKAYDSIYGLNKISDMFQAQHVDVINSHFDGHHSGSTINSKLDHATNRLFNSSFLNKLQGTGSHIIKNKFALNNIYDWKPKAPTRLYHGPNDEVVPYSNSQKALNSMNSNGAKNVSLVDCGFDTHGECAFPYVLNAVNFFSTYANDL